MMALLARVWAELAGEAGLEQVLNRPCVMIITNAALSIISTKMKRCSVFQFDSVLAFFVKNSCLTITE